MMNFLALAAAAPEVEAKLLGLGTEEWVYVGITIFLVLMVWKVKAHRLVANALDAHIAEARRSLDEATAIRGEAETLLRDAEARLTAAKDDAKAMLAHARREADALRAKMEADTSDMVARRERMAADKISAAERAAVDTIRARAANGAVDAARRVIAGSHDAANDKTLVDGAIGAL